MLPVVDAAKMKIIPLQEEHFPAVSRIYAEGMASGIATFETMVPNWEQWNVKFLPVCRYVMLMGNEVVAWCALSPVSKRTVYKGVAEDTIYVDSKFQKKGIGKLLLSFLVEESEKSGFWTLQAGIFSENTSSIHLHELCGFRIIGVREKVAQRDGVWHDNVLMERRSSLNLNEAKNKL